MKKLLLILALPSLAFAGGPKSTFPEPRGLDAEINNIYHDIANPVINIGNASTMTITQLNVSSITATGRITASSMSATNFDAINSTITHLVVTSNDGIPGTIAQIVVGNALNTSFATTNNTFTSTGLTATIVTKKATNKVMIFAVGELTNANASSICKATITRGGTNISGANGFIQEENGIDTPAMIHYLDTPGSVGSFTYAVAILNTGGVNCNWNRLSGQSIMTLYEIWQ